MDFAQMQYHNIDVFFRIYDIYFQTVAILL